MARYLPWWFSAGEANDAGTFFVPAVSHCLVLEWVKLQLVTRQTQGAAKHLSEDWDQAYLYSEILSLHG